MKRRWLAGLVVAALLIAGYVALRPHGAPDRVYKGKPVSQWVDVCIEKPANTFNTNEAAFQPVREIGADAVPYLVKAIEGKQGLRGTKFYNSVWKHLPTVIEKKLPIPKDSESIRIRAYWTLGALGPVAKPAVPALIREFNTNNTMFDFARAALTTLGPDAKEAVPMLTNALHGPDGMLKWNAGRVLAKVEPTYPGLMPVMLADLKSTNVITRRFACVTLGQMGSTAKSAVPALNEALQDTDASVQRNAATALKEIGP
jgi:HEAT repeat protein